MKLQLSQLKVTSVTVRFGVTANLGNFNSVNFTEEMTVEVQPGQSADDIRTTLLTEIEASVFNKVTSLKKGRKSE
jgi:hypothetical protein